MEFLDEKCCVKNQIRSSETNVMPSPLQCEVDVEVKREILSQDTLTSSLEAENVGHVGGVSESYAIGMKSEPESPEEHVSTAEHSLNFVKNPFTAIRKRLIKLRSKIRPKVLELPIQIKPESITTAEDQTELLNLLDVVDPKTSHEFEENNISYIEHIYPNVSMTPQYTINESELIIKSDQIYENDNTTSKVDDYTNTDCNYSQEYNGIKEEHAILDEPLNLYYSDDSDEYSAKDNVTNFTNNSLSYGFEIINVTSLAKQDTVLVPSPEPQPPPLKKKVGRPKRKVAAIQIPRERSEDIDYNKELMLTQFKKKVGRPKRSVTAKQTSYVRNAESSYKKRKYKKRKIKKLAPSSKSSHSQTKAISVKAIDYPRPLKLEDEPNPTAENDIVTELPRPMVFKCEPMTSMQLSHIYRNWKLQPKVCLKRLSLKPMQLNASNCANHGTAIFRNNLQFNDGSKFLRPRYHSPTPGAESSTSNSHCDSGVSSTSHSHGENEHTFLEIAAERAFINHHLTNFGFSPLQFELYNDLKDLCTFSKYLFGKPNTIN